MNQKQAHRIDGFPLVAPHGRFNLRKWRSHHTPYDPECEYCVEAEDFAASKQWEKVEDLVVSAAERAWTRAA